MSKTILSNNLKDLLNRKGKTQTDMAKELDLKESTVSSWINGLKYPRRDKIELLADYFNVQPSDITDDKNTYDTIAAHLEDDFTEEELQKIRDFAELVRQARKRTDYVERYEELLIKYNHLLINDCYKLPGNFKGFYDNGVILIDKNLSKAKN